MKTKRVHLLVVAAALWLGATQICSAAPQLAAPVSRILTPYITTLNFAKQGAFTGQDALPSGTGNGIKLASVQHSVTAPIDPATGQRTGQRIHGLFTVVKQLDANTPKLYQALVNNEIISQMVVRFYGTLANGTTTNIFTYTLSNVTLAAVRNWQPNANDPAAVPYVHPEEVSFSYQTISWRDDLTGVEAVDTRTTSP